MDFQKSLQKIVHVFEEERINYMIVGGFAMSYYNRFRFTADIDCVIQAYSDDVQKIVQHFPDWFPFIEDFKGRIEQGAFFRLTDLDTGVKYEFLPQESCEYGEKAFERRRRVAFFGIECFIAGLEDLIVTELWRYSNSPKSTRLEDLKFLLKEDGLDQPYLEVWTNRLNLMRYGLF